MVRVTLSIICRNQEEAECYAKELQNTDTAQNSLFCWGIDIEDCSKDEIEETRKHLTREEIETL